LTTHILAITYQPKIEGVRNGTIRQTIRVFNPENPRELGDRIILHGWKGKPYRSPWSWRREGRIISIGLFQMSADCVRDTLGNMAFWGSSEQLKKMAEFDGIKPATGIELKHILESYHGKFTDKPVQMQVIRW